MNRSLLQTDSERRANLDRACVRRFHLAIRPLCQPSVHAERLERRAKNLAIALKRPYQAAIQTKSDIASEKLACLSPSSFSAKMAPEARESERRPGSVMCGVSNVLTNRPPRPNLRQRQAWDAAVIPYSLYDQSTTGRFPRSTDTVVREPQMFCDITERRPRTDNRGFVPCPSV